MEDRVSRLERASRAMPRKHKRSPGDGDGVMLGRVLVYAVAVMVALVLIVLRRF